MVHFGGEVLNTGHKHSFFNRVLSINVHSHLMDPCPWPSLVTSQPSHVRRRMFTFCSQYHSGFVRFYPRLTAHSSRQHLGVDINRLVSGFIRFRDITPGGPPAWFANPSDPSFVFKNAVYSFQTALGDGVVVRTDQLGSLTVDGIFSRYTGATRFGTRFG
jgi:hypothetical protein